MQTLTRASGLPGQTVIHVIQGEHRVSDDPEVILGTILGSCVATCIWDPESGVGGMNHFLLPDGVSRSSAHHRYGLYAMELLINDLLKMGARRHRLRAKLFGGATMHDGLGRIGDSNGRFARDYLRDEGITCVAESLGGTSARRIRFVPVTGQARQMKLDNASIDQPEPDTPRRSADDVTFF